MMKVLSFNVGYFLGFPAQRRWIRRPHRLLFGNRSIESDGIDSLIDLITDENPDVVALQEVDMGSFRSGYTSQVSEISDKIEDRGLNYSYRADNKYDSRTTISNIPILKHMSNMIFWHSGNAYTRYLSTGVKRLVHVVERPDSLNVISVHLSKTRDTRLDQLEELVSIINKFEPAIVTGDFNIKDEADYRVVTSSTDLSLHIPGKSFSTAHPTHAFDVFLVPSDVNVVRCETLSDVTFSDHLPVILETE